MILHIVGAVSHRTAARIFWIFIAEKNRHSLHCTTKQSSNCAVRHRTYYGFRVGYYTDFRHFISHCFTSWIFSASQPKQSLTPTVPRFRTTTRQSLIFAIFNSTNPNISTFSSPILSLGNITPTHLYVTTFHFAKIRNFLQHHNSS